MKTYSQLSFLHIWPIVNQLYLFMCKCVMEQTSKYEIASVLFHHHHCRHHFLMCHTVIYLSGSCLSSSQWDLLSSSLLAEMQVKSLCGLKSGLESASLADSMSYRRRLSPAEIWSVPFLLELVMLKSETLYMCWDSPMRPDCVSL